MRRQMALALLLLAQPWAVASDGISPGALESCAKAGVAECQFKWGKAREAAGDVASAKKFYELAYAGKYEPAGQALLRLVRGEEAAERRLAAPAEAVSASSAVTARVTPNTVAGRNPEGPGATDRVKLSDQPLPGQFVGNPSKKLHTCWEATFTQQIRGEMTALPDWRPGVFKELSAEPTSQVFVFCFSPYGTPGSGMYAGKTFIQLRQLDDKGVLAGTYTNPDKTLTNFHFVNSTDDKLPGYATNRPDLPKGTSVLQVTPNIKKFKPGLPMFELRGTSRKVPVPN